MLSGVLTNYGVCVPCLAVTTFTSENILNILVCRIYLDQSSQRKMFMNISVRAGEASPPPSCGI